VPAEIGREEAELGAPLGSSTPQPMKVLENKY